MPGFAADALDVTGAGGGFGVAFVVQAMAGDDPYAAARDANEAAALSTRYGALAPIPDAQGGACLASALLL